jgi:hypothetical protein
MKSMLIAVVLLAGCASPPAQVQWQRAGASPQDMAKDEGQCRARAYTPTAGGPIVRPGAAGFARAQVQTLDFESCMQTRGWLPVRTPG